MATRRSSSITLPSSLPIDYIDLTEDSPCTSSRASSRSTLTSQRCLDTLGNLIINEEILGTLNSAIRTAANVAISVSRNLNRNATRSVIETRRSTKSTTKARSNNTASKKSRSNSNNKCQNETILLDNTISPKHNGPSCTNDTTTLICAICLEGIKTNNKPTATSCGHIFCEKCLNRAICKVKQCPRCRKSITKRSCIRLYF